MNLEAMKELLAVVETGGHILWGLSSGPARQALGDKWPSALDAYFGDMNAALSLHAALLPGWVWGRDLGGRFWVAKSTWDALYSPELEGDASTPARALLIATLRGKIAELDADKEDAE
jgi:hypothetical protein